MRSGRLPGQRGRAERERHQGRQGLTGGCTFQDDLRDLRSVGRSPHRGWQRRYRLFIDTSQEGKLFRIVDSSSIAQHVSAVFLLPSPVNHFAKTFVGAGAKTRPIGDMRRRQCSFESTDAVVQHNDLDSERLSRCEAARRPRTLSSAPPGISVRSFAA